MDTRRHVSIAQLTSVAMLGLLGRHVGWRAIVTVTKAAAAGARAKGTLRCSGRRMDTLPPNGSCEAREKFPCVNARQISHLADFWFHP